MSYDPVLDSLTNNDEVTDLSKWERLGFRFGDKGTHTSRTIMLRELTTLLQACPGRVPFSSYAVSVINQNSLGKRTNATRILSLQRLRELYGLDNSLPLFRVLQDFWPLDQASQPLLALLLALARDPLLRATTAPVLRTPVGEELLRQNLIEILNDHVSGRINEMTLNKVVRNAASTWTQSGHLRGHSHKYRQMVAPTAIVTAYALLLGYLIGARGKGLFGTIWAEVLDIPSEELVNLAREAKRYGYLELYREGGFTEISFNRLLKEEERRILNG